MLNADQIVEKHLLKLEQSKGKKAQVGYDLSLKSISKIGTRLAGTNTYAGGKIGKVLKDKTEIATQTPYPLSTIDEVTGWMLHPGVYDITFWEGCKLPDNYVGLLRQRSSLLRNGTIIHSSVFDPGFETENMGCVMIVNEPIFIERDARVAQMYFHECEPVDELYNGQFQGDRQRIK